MSWKTCACLLSRNVNRLTKSLLILFIFAAQISFAQTYTLSQINADLKKVDKSLNITKQKMKEVGDISFLPDLYFVLADLYHEKSRLLYEEAKTRYPKKNQDDLDLGASKKAKKLAIETYIRFTENYPKDDMVDKAYYNVAMSYRELGQIDDMVKTFIKITKDFPKSKFWEESQLRLGDYFFDRKKDYQLALEVYQKILDRPATPYISFAKYKMGWCYINMNEFDKALNIYESVLLVDAKTEFQGELSEELKATDIKRDALIALVWPYTEMEKHTPERANAAVYFETLSYDRMTLIQALNRLGKRLMVKVKDVQAVPVFARLIEISYDLETRMNAINSFYEAYKKSKKPFAVDKIIKIISITMSQIRNSAYISASDKKNSENNFEIYLRDLATELNTQAQSARTEKLYNLSSEIYEDYLILFPNSKHASDIQTNLAEVYFQTGQFVRAGYFYEKAFLKTKNAKVLQSAIRAYGESLKNQEKLSRLQLEESRSGYSDLGTQYVKMFPNEKATVEVDFNIAKILYDQRRFDQAVLQFQKFTQKYPGHAKAKQAIHLILDTYNQREDYKGLVKFGQSIISQRSPASQDAEFGQEIQEIVKQAQFRTIEDKAGDPRNRDYAKRLLDLGKKYKGSALGDLAIYEAFSNFKNKKDPLVYSAGEQLLQKHSDSKYAKQVVADMGQIAIQSGDFDRAADYFEKFINAYPNDELTGTLLKSAAVLRENQGDYDKAVEHYKKLRAPFSKLADLLSRNKKWRELNQLASSQATQNIATNYYIGLSLVRLGESKSASPYFEKLLRLSPSTEEEKVMSAHSLYLKASDALKDYRQLKFGRGDDGEVTKLKGEKLKVLNQFYDKVIAYGNGKWVIGALYELGQSYREFSEFLGQAPIPAGLTPDVIQAYKQAISSQSSDYKTKSDQYFKSCLTNAEKYEVFTLFVKGCRSGGDYLVDEAKDEFIVRKPAGTTTPDIQRIRTSLLDKSDQPELIKKLGEIYIKNQDFGMAKLAFNRYLEMKPQSADVYSWLGVIEMHNLDFEKAKNYFRAALEQDSKSSLAQLGLAAMYRKFGFQSLYNNFAGKLPADRAQYSGAHPWIVEIL